MPLQKAGATSDEFSSTYMYVYKYLVCWMKEERLDSASLYNLLVLICVVKISLSLSDPDTGARIRLILFVRNTKGNFDSACNKSYPLFGKFTQVLCEQCQVRSIVNNPKRRPLAAFDFSNCQ